MKKRDEGEKKRQRGESVWKGRDRGKERQKERMRERWKERRGRKKERQIGRDWEKIDEEIDCYKGGWICKRWHFGLKRPPPGFSLLAGVSLWLVSRDASKRVCRRVQEFSHLTRMNLDLCTVPTIKLSCAISIHGGMSDKSQLRGDAKRFWRQFKKWETNLNRFIWRIERTHTSTTTPGQSGSWSDVYKGVLYNCQISGTLASLWAFSFSRHFFLF